MKRKLTREEYASICWVGPGLSWFGVGCFLMAIWYCSWKWFATGILLWILGTLIHRGTNLRLKEFDGGEK